jgi:hypothetical protein
MPPSLAPRWGSRRSARRSGSRGPASIGCSTPCSGPRGLASRRERCRLRNASRCWTRCTRIASWTRRRRRSMRRCSTKGSTSARSARCTACSRPTRRCASVAISFGILPTRSPSCWPHGPTSSGAGTSPSCWDRRRGRTFISTSSSTCSADMSSPGWWRPKSPRRSRKSS